jgi:hypothetical protein
VTRGWQARERFIKTRFHPVVETLLASAHDSASVLRINGIFQVRHHHHHHHHPHQQVPPPYHPPHLILIIITTSTMSPPSSRHSSSSSPRVSAAVRAALPTG